MDKQKQIEEMIDIQRKNCLGKGICDCVDADCNACSALAFYTAGYRKIPEGAVVLTGMETEQRFEDLMVAFDEMGFMPNTTHPFPEEYVETWKQRLIFVFGQLRKETADKFAERLKFKLEKHTRKIMREDYQQGAYIYMVESSDIETCIDEIAKEIMEGKV